MSPDFFTLLERQLTEAAERDLATGRKAPAAVRRAFDLPRLRELAPIAVAFACVALIAGLVLSTSGEDATLPGPSGPRVGTTGPTAATPRGPTPTRAEALGSSGLIARQAARGVRVFVLNGTTRNGLAAEQGRVLEASGFLIAGTSNTTTDAARKSTVYATEQAAGAAVALALGISGSVAPPSRELRNQAPNADVIVLAGTDLLSRDPPRTYALRGERGATGSLGLTPTTQGTRLTLTGKGLPKSDLYLVWLETRAGKRVRLGFAFFAKGEIRGEVALTEEQARPRRVFVTQQVDARAAGAGRVVLDSGVLSRG